MIRSITTLLFLIFSIPVSAELTNWDTVKATYDFHFKGMGANEKLMSLEGEKIISDVQKFVSNPKNRKYLDTKEGNQFLNQHSKYVNFLKNKQTLEKCNNDKNSKRKLEESILLGTLNQQAHLTSCKREELLMLKSVFNLSSVTEDISKEFLRESFQDSLHKTSLLNTVDTYLEKKYRYDPTFGKSPLTTREKKDLLKTICKGRKFCPPKLKKEIMARIDNKVNNLRKSADKTTPEKITKEMNAKINGINKKLDEVKIPRDKGVLTSVFENGVHFFIPGVIDTADPDLEDKGFQKGFNNYLKSYVDATNDEDGKLFYTSSIRDEMGQLRTKDSDENIDEDTTLTTSTYAFDKHENVDQDDIEDAIDETYEKIEDQFRSLGLIRNKVTEQKNSLKRLQASGSSYARKNLTRIKDFHSKDFQKNIKNLIKANPKAVSQILVNQPEYGLLVCDALIDLDKDDEETMIDDVLLYGGIALGVLGFVTGGATWLLAGALSAGTVATLGTVTTGLIIASTAAELTSGAISIGSAYQMNQEAMQVEQGLIAGNGADNSLEFMRDSYLKYKNALYDAGTNAAISLTGMGALGAINRLKKANATMKFSDRPEGSIELGKAQIDNLTDMYKYFDENKKVGALVGNTIKKLGKKGQDKFDEFMAQLAYLPNEQRDRFLLALSKLPANSPKLKELVSKALCKR